MVQDVAETPPSPKAPPHSARIRRRSAYAARTVLQSYVALIFAVSAASADPQRTEAQGIVDGSPKEVFDVITDYDHYADFMPRGKESRVLKREGNALRYYSKLNMPWPVSDIWFDTDVRWSEDRKTINFEKVPGSGKGVVSFKGKWTLKEHGAEKTRTMVGYEVMFEPETKWPDWVVQIGQRATIGKMMEAIQKRVAVMHMPR